MGEGSRVSRWRGRSAAERSAVAGLARPGEGGRPPPFGVWARGEKRSEAGDSGWHSVPGVPVASRPVWFRAVPWADARPQPHGRGAEGSLSPGVVGSPRSSGCGSAFPLGQGTPLSLRGDGAVGTWREAEPCKFFQFCHFFLLKRRKTCRV